MDHRRWTHFVGEQSVYRNRTRNWHPYDVRSRMRLCNCGACIRSVNLETGKEYRPPMFNQKGRHASKIERSKYNIQMLEDREWKRSRDAKNKLAKNKLAKNKLA